MYQLGWGYPWNFCGCTGGPTPCWWIEAQLSASLPSGRVCGPSCLTVLCEQMRLWVLGQGSPLAWLSQYFFLDFE